MPLIKSFYFYPPSQPLAGVACGLFALSFICSVFQWIKYRAWVWIFMVISCGMEAAGYGARIVSAGDVTARTVYIVQFCLIVLAPVLMAGVIYVVFGRIVFHVVPAHARTTRLLWVPPRFITPIFVSCDVVALFLQLIGAVIISGTQPTDKDVANKLKKGKDIALIGVTAQITVFGLFSIIAARFHFASRRFASDMEKRYNITQGSKYVSIENTRRKFNPNWRTMLFVINTSCLLILIRSIYREADFAMGKGSYLEHHEVFVYVLDTLPMLGVVVVYNIWHPGRYLPYLGFRLPKSERHVAGNARGREENIAM